MAGPLNVMSSQLGSNDQDQAMASSVPVKNLSRPGTLHALDGIPSLPSPTRLGHERWVSDHNRSRSMISCVSLAAAAAKASELSSTITAAMPQPSLISMESPSALLYSPPTPEFPFKDEADESLAIAKCDPEPSTTHTTTLSPPDSALDRKGKLEFRFWESMPHELRVHIFSFFRPRELVQASIVSKSFYCICFDGQLWARLDASEFYQDIPAASLTKIIATAGPFIRHLNLRGCVQVEHFKRTEIILKSCQNLVEATLEGCRNFQRKNLHGLIASNRNLVHLNLTGLMAVSNVTCQAIAESCYCLESLNVSWCQKVEARGLKEVIDSCPRLRDLRAGEVKGFDDVATAISIFETNRLERLILCGCADLTDETLKIMMHGVDPEIDILTNLPIVRPRKLRHLDLSRCIRLTSNGVRHIGHVTPRLEGLQLSGCKRLTDAALEPIFASTPQLTYLELEDLELITNMLLSEHLACAPCAGRLKHICLSHCENVGDTGMISLLHKCHDLRSIDLDNTKISDTTLHQATKLLGRRAKRCAEQVPPSVTLRLAIYDCQNVTWAGVRSVMLSNSQPMPSADETQLYTYPTEVIGLKCFYGHQMTFDEHLKRVLRGDLKAACQLESKWAAYMHSLGEGQFGIETRRRRRRAREMQVPQLEEEDAGVIGRRRARTLGSCTMM